MDLGLTGKTALVLGASSGLGRAIALGLAREGANVAVAARNEAALAALAGEIEALGVRALPVRWDLADLTVIDGNIAAVEASVGPVDILINNTGGPPPTTASGQSPDLWTAQFQAMVASVIATTDRVLPGMIARRWGRIITSTSSGVIAPIANLAISNALRLSLVGWSKTLAREVARDGVTCNIVVPGRIATDRTRFLDEKRAEREGRSIDQVEAASLGAIPVGRYGDPAEYADVVAFLASTRASYVTGSTVRVDGGQIASI
jgi:3-oxoacyl-[acyl-carrier protein] reductase